MSIKMLCFDLDGTLAESKQSLSEEMGALLARATESHYISIITGAAWPQIEKQVLPVLQKHCKNLNKVILCPTCATRTYAWDESANSFKELYSLLLTDSQKASIVATLNAALEAEELLFPQLWGPQVEDRGTQITFSALGQQAPLEEKMAWDPDFSKRQRIKSRMEPFLADFSIRLGGTTSIDITLAGIDKAFGIRKLSELCSISEDSILFFGDALFPGGNDFAVRSTSANCVEVESPSDTLKKVSEYLDSGVFDSALRAER